MGMSEFPVQAKPNRHPHLHTARSGDIAQINDVAAFPAKPFAEPIADFTLRGSVVSADEEVVVARDERWLHHDLAIDRVESLHDAHIRELTLYTFAQ